MTYDPQYKLTFAGTPVGVGVHGLFEPEIVYATEPRIIHPFWSKTVIIDNRYPAIVYRYNFQVVFGGESQSNSLTSYATDFYQQLGVDLSSINTPGYTTAHTLLLTDSDNNPVISWGMCTPEGVSNVEPEEFLVHSFGMVEIRFLGTTLPVSL